VEEVKAVTIREPDIHHNNWGIELRWDDPFGNAIECQISNQFVLKYARDMNWQPFHQGGQHTLGDRCGGWHYWEFWGLPGGDQTECPKEVETLIEILNTQNKDQLGELLWG
jgi:hypothetical protein